MAFVCFPSSNVFGSHGGRCLACSLSIPADTVGQLDDRCRYRRRYFMPSRAALITCLGPDALLLTFRG